MNAIVTRALEIFQGFRMPTTPIDEWDKGGKEILADKLSSFVNAGSPMKFSMLGFPMKSVNVRDKVLGSKPDYGEQASLHHFSSFATHIREIYSPGVQFSIISDGYIFNDLLGVEDKIVAEYEEICTDMARVAPVKWHNATDFYNCKSLSSLRQKIMGQFGITSEVLHQRILTDPNVSALYRGMMKFMVEETTMNSYPSNSQHQNAAKKLAREMMLRNEAYSALMKENFSDHIRLSMHPSTNNGTKYSFQLIPGPNAHHSPWHAAVVVEKDGTLSTMHKKDAEEKGHQLVYKDNQPYYFTAQT